MATPFASRRPEMKRGFTLVELLVVIAIIAVLSALGFGVVSTGIVRAKQANCSSNMRQIGIALNSFAVDNNGFFPETTHTADLNRAWIAALEEELGSGYDEFRLCPAAPRMKERKERGGTSYVLNSYIFVPEIGPFGEELSKPLNCLNCIPEPERTLMAFIVSDHQTVEATSDHTHSRAWTGSWKDVLRDIQPDRHRVGSAAPDHSKGVSNYLFVDGHVESWRASEVKRRVEAGENIAEPPGILAEG